MTYWSGPGSQGSGAWSFMLGDYTKNWASVSLHKPSGAQWLSGLFSLTGRWKQKLVFGHASLRENLAWDVNKGLKSEGNHSGPISHSWKPVISHSDIHISRSLLFCLFYFHKIPSRTTPNSNKSAVSSNRRGVKQLWLNNEAVMVGCLVFNMILSCVHSCPKAWKRLLMKCKPWPGWKEKLCKWKVLNRSCRQMGNTTCWTLIFLRRQCCLI